MWKLNADVFYWVSAALQRLRISAKTLADKQHLDLKRVMPTKNQEETLAPLKSLNEELAILGARMTMASVERFMVILSRNECTYSEMIDLTNDIDRRLRDELAQVNVYVLDEHKIKYFTIGSVLFGQEVADKFPLSIPDIEDAGKCLSFGQDTASVFHSMRVMESGLKRLAELLDIPYAPSWESYLKKITDKISEKHKSKDDAWKANEAAFRDMLGDIQAIKIAWRNPTMHIVRRYSADEAEEIFRAIKAFMIRLTSLI